MTRMHCTFRAPELSATSSMERGWIIAPPSPEWSGCASASPWTAGASPDHHAVAHVALVRLVVRLELLGHADDPLVARMTEDPLDPHHPRLLHGIAHHDALTTLALAHGLPFRCLLLRRGLGSLGGLRRRLRGLGRLAGLRLLDRWGRGRGRGRRRRRHRERQGHAAALALDRV